MLQNITTEVPPPQLIAMATPKGLMVRGPCGVVLLSNKTLSAVAEFAIALQDLISPDPDLEETGTEDGFLTHHANGPGCPVADCGEEDDHGGGKVTDEPHDACLEDGL